MKFLSIKLVFVITLVTISFSMFSNPIFAQTKKKPKTTKKVSKTVKKPVAPIENTDQTAPIKKNERTETSVADSPVSSTAELKANNRETPTNKPQNANLNLYSYEFSQPKFLISNIFISHDEKGKGSIIFQQKDTDFQENDPLQVSPAALERIQKLWDELNFLDSTENYQAEKQFPHLGTMQLKRQKGSQIRVAEFNWTDNKAAKSLVEEYRKLGDQFIWIFDINVARENQPLETPKLIERVEQMISRNNVSDKNQMLPFFKELQTDERLPLMARNRLGKIIKNIEKEK